MLDVSVIICTYADSRWSQLVAAVRSIEQQSVQPGEIIVVVDHNRALAERIRSEFSRVITVENSGERGLSGARNAGIAASHDAILAFLDDDAVADPTWLATLVAPYANPAVAAVGGSIQPTWTAGRPVWFPPEFDWVVGCSYRGMPDQTSPVRNLIGCNMSFRREVFAEVGLFRDGIGRVGDHPLGCEETQLCIATLQRWPGRIILFHPAAGVRHTIPPRRACWRYFRSRCYAEGVSKALISSMVGTVDSLSAEWSYTVRTLPGAVLEGIACSAKHRNCAGAMRSGAIVVGLVLTTAGYVRGRLARREQRPMTVAVDRSIATGANVP